MQEIKEDQEWVNEMRKKLDERLKELEQEKDKKRRIIDFLKYPKSIRKEKVAE